MSGPEIPASRPVVVDVGCATYPDHPDDESMMALITRFDPSIYRGFDPHPTVVERDGWIGGTRVIIERKAAWVHEGTVGYVVPPRVQNPLRAFTTESDPATVACFDLAAFLRTLPGDVVLKIDAEGAEYALLPHLCEQGVDSALSLLLVEWHGPPADLPFRCPVEAW